MADPCPPCNCDDTQEILALKQQIADLKASITSRKSTLLGEIDSLMAELSALQQKNIEFLRPRADICTGAVLPQSLNDIKTYRFGNKCG